jgi:hypothetical protein
MARGLGIKVTRLTVAGWLLLLASLGVIGLIAAVVGPWALESLGRDVLRSGGRWIYVLLAIPALIGGLLTFWVGARLLAASGVRVQRR